MDGTATHRGNKYDIIRLNVISPALESMELISCWFQLWIPHCLHAAEEQMNRQKNYCFDSLKKFVYMKLMDLLEPFWAKKSGFERDAWVFAFFCFFSFLDLKANIYQSKNINAGVFWFLGSHMKS